MTSHQTRNILHSNDAARLTAAKNARLALIKGIKPAVISLRLRVASLDVFCQKRA